MVRRAVMVSLALAVLAALVVGAWWAVSAMKGSNSANSEDPIRATADVEVRTLERTVVTRGVAGFASAAPMTAAGSGRVTAVWVASGSVVKAGDRILEIEGRPMVAVEGARPLWRDLAEGDSGPDVESLQQVLEASGYLSFDPDGTFGSGTKAALQAWQGDHRFPEPDGMFRVDDWMVGRWPRRVGQVMVRVGEFTNPGSELFVPTDRRPSVSIEMTPSDRLLVSRGDKVRVEVAATGSTARGIIEDLGVTPVTRNDGSTVYKGTVLLKGRLDAPEGTQVPVTIVVDRALDVIAVPVASLVSDDDGGPAVRVVLGSGSVETVSVELGLSEGAWVEVVSGLRGDERVLVAEE
jgi:peptidoglycan hydrolase-like protein with peptidoglycan-binding domain